LFADVGITLSQQITALIREETAGNFKLRFRTITTIRLHVLHTFLTTYLLLRVSFKQFMSNRNRSSCVTKCLNDGLYDLSLCQQSSIIAWRTRGQ